MKSAAINLGTLGYLLGVLDALIIDGLPIDAATAKKLREMLRKDVGDDLAKSIAQWIDDNAPD